MNLSDFDFELPAELIAQRPAETRDSSRLMVIDRKRGEISHHAFHELPQLIPDNCLLTFNNARVVPGKLFGRIDGSDRIFETLIVSRDDSGTCRALIKGLSRLKPGLRIRYCDGTLEAVFAGREDAYAVLKFDVAGDALKKRLIEQADMPLPPYIKRSLTDETELKQLDRDRYQTVFARNDGAVAAPTAGLHFTETVMDQLKQAGATLAYLTLLVGPGTFQPIREEIIEKHRMENENFLIEREEWNKLVIQKKEGKPILAVGTTCVRTLESVKLTVEAGSNISGSTDIFIYPGHDIKNVDLLLTNFHLPKSTLFLLTCAFGGSDLIKQAYHEAIKQKYRFFSYGDAMLIT
ncbi:MAG: tRNA preQ1(34) S-adenosylmethionine ribosyltransferase-isomerase QueA [Candidatus Nitrohelix vancouverensis]|uniref:S-adenosylmethionine:tRNA ribosyltransferase-isomerase n=1 Tax=Candidatus Nitrohelix vancouverensis TaxID=2705534 RepID=A0A7T0C3E4_9BACT|nr:MAG: tRNA preQ1(34) S-adenosylmethionine ribosyltransferase-isomerase QueA [Candidatus Nitrohelix vancouverensis]